MEENDFEGWVILELMGHRKLAGYARAQEIAGSGFLRLDVPLVSDPDPKAMAASQLYNPKAIYCLTPTTEKIARAVAASVQPAPVARWELPEPERAPQPARDDHHEYQDEGALS